MSNSSAVLMDQSPYFFICYTVSEIPEPEHWPLAGIEYKFGFFVFYFDRVSNSGLQISFVPQKFLYLHPRKFNQRSIHNIWWFAYVPFPLIAEFIIQLQVEPVIRLLVFIHIVYRGFCKFLVNPL